MQSDVLLKNQGVRELLVAHRTLVQHSHWWFGTMNSHVGLQVALSRECSTAYLTFERSFTCVRAIVHLKRTFAR